MTCIVGWLHDGRVTIGGDSAALDTNTNRMAQRMAPKVFANGPMVMGFTSSFRMGDLLEHALTVPGRARSVSVDKFMRTQFIDAVRACLKTGGFARIENGVEAGGTFLVGYEGRLFCVYRDFQVGENQDGFDAVGGGEFLALGALGVLRKLGRKSASVRAKLRTALEITARYNAGVSAPFTFVTGGERTRA